MKALFYLSILLSSIISQPLMGKEIKTLVLIIDSNDLPVYAGLQKVWKSYMNIDPEHFECYFLRGDANLPTQYAIEGDTIWSKTEENFIPGILNKTLLSLEAMLPRLSEFDYVLRANLSSFFIFPRLLEFLKTLPKTECYSGFCIALDHIEPMPDFLGNIIKLPDIISGSGIIMSTDVAKILIDNSQSMFNLSNCSRFNIDDVVIGTCLNQNGIDLIPTKWVEIYDISKWNEIRIKIPEDVFQIRVKTEEPFRVRIDPYIHSQLLLMFYGVKLNITYLNDIKSSPNQ